jgi:hypothetical protein
MPSLQDYSSRGKRYYRIVESYRDERGRPRIRVLRHLGTAQKLLERLSQSPGRAIYAEERDFGATAALWDTAQQLEIVSIIDRHAPKRDQGASVGEYILTATLNRALAPTSKRKLASWYRDTILTRLLPLSPAALRSQRFWDHMSYLDESTLAAIEDDITRRVVEGLNVDLRALFYDTTNFDTFLSSDNGSDLAQRGHAKSKRTDLRIVGLALLVSWDFHIPLFSNALLRKQTRLRHLQPGSRRSDRSLPDVQREMPAHYTGLRQREQLGGKHRDSGRFAVPFHRFACTDPAPGSLRHSFGTVSLPQGSAFRRRAGLSHGEGSFWEETHDRHYPKPRFAPGASARHKAASGQEAKGTARTPESCGPQP